MASTYSSLKIQLMATGENSGTWGTVTNTNLGTAIEEAIVGSADVPFSNADVTLTLTDTNATQSARNLRLNLTGTITTAQSLIVPAIEKIYIVNNGLTNTVTVKNSTGTGTDVPAGKTMFVYNDGTNVVDAVNHLTSLTLGSALPIASGGTGSNTATFSGANITSLNASNISSGTLANARTTAASANGASTIVARDASGDFAANVITANGSSITSINASNISSGTLANARTTASSSNGASTIVARDASGDFTGYNISATNFIGTLNGSGANVTSINANNISTGTLVVARGGTGAATLTGLVVGNGTSAFTTVTAPSGTVVGTTDTQTLTNKRITPRAVAAGSTSGNLTINGDTTDLYYAEGLTGAITFLQPSGTPTDGQKLMIRIEDNGTARGITWTTSAGAFRAVGIALPTTTVLGKVTYVGCVYNSTDSFWDAVATVTQA